MLLAFQKCNGYGNNLPYKCNVATYRWPGLCIYIIITLVVRLQRLLT